MEDNKADTEHRKKKKQYTKLDLSWPSDGSVSALMKLQPLKMKKSRATFTTKLILPHLLLLLIVFNWTQYFNAKFYQIVI